MNSGTGGATRSNTLPTAALLPHHRRGSNSSTATTGSTHDDGNWVSRNKCFAALLVTGAATVIFLLCALLFCFVGKSSSAFCGNNLQQRMNLS